MCHGLIRLTDPSGWSRSLNAPNTQRARSRAATPQILQKRGTNWDGASSEDAGEHPSGGSKKARGTSWDNRPIKDNRDQSFYGSTGSKKRGTNWDNAPPEDTTLQDPYGTGVVGCKKSGTAWGNILGEDKSKALGPKVGQGGPNRCMAMPGNRVAAWKDPRSQRLNQEPTART
ncbi:MAG: hypothetical protein LQ337_007096 [Flavoplaca oasis]|nr:MAG: hypothetical protein LQ337_007096 [Flavoplaca oasis]